MAGCSGPGGGAFKTTRDSAYTGKLHRPLMLYQEGWSAPGLEGGFPQQVLERVAILLGERNVPSAILRLKAGESDGKAQMDAVVTRFTPSHLLHFAAVDSPQSGGKHAFDFRLTDMEGGKEVWRTQVSYSSVPKPATVALELVEQLELAGLVDGPEPDQSQ